MVAASDSAGGRAADDDVSMDATSGSTRGWAADDVSIEATSDSAGGWAADDVSMDATLDSAGSTEDSPAKANKWAYFDMVFLQQSVSNEWLW